MLVLISTELVKIIKTGHRKVEHIDGGSKMIWELTPLHSLAVDPYTDSWYVFCEGNHKNRCAQFAVLDSRYRETDSVMPDDDVTMLVMSSYRAREIHEDAMFAKISG